MIVKIIKGEINELPALPKSEIIEGLEVILKGLDNDSLVNLGYYPVIEEPLGVDETYKNLSMTDLVDGTFHRKTRPLTPAEINIRDQQAIQDEIQNALAKGFTVEFKGKNITFSQNDLNNFITLKNEHALAGIETIEWLYNDMTWASMTTQEATGVGLEAIQLMQDIFKGN